MEGRVILNLSLGAWLGSSLSQFLMITDEVSLNSSLVWLYCLDSLTELINKGLREPGSPPPMLELVMIGEENELSSCRDVAILSILNLKFNFSFILI